MKTRKRSTDYTRKYRSIDFRAHPEAYEIGRGEQGVLIAQPYKSEILPHWKFATVESAQRAARTIYKMFLSYGKKKEFVGMDMARKFLQMGWTRARRYANHPSGRKYDAKGRVLPLAKDAMTSEKAKAASIFFSYYDRARNHPLYLKRKREWENGARRLSGIRMKPSRLTTEPSRKSTGTK